MWKALAAIAAALTVPLAPILVFTGALTGPQVQTQTISATCAGWAGDTPAGIELDASQMNRAALIYAAALDTGVGPAGAVVGIATAMQESVLGAHPAGLGPSSMELGARPLPPHEIREVVADAPESARSVLDRLSSA